MTFITAQKTARRFIALIVCLCPATLFAQREGVLLDGESFAGELLEIKGREALFRTADEGSAPKRVALGELLRWGEPAPVAKRPLVILNQGSKIVAAPAWTKEGSITFADNLLRVRQLTLGPVALPRSLVDSVRYEAATDPQLFARAIREARRYNGPSDRVWLVNGDAFSGRLVSIEEGSVALEVEGETIRFDSKQTALLKFGGTPAQSPPAKPPQSGLAVGLRDGGLLIAKEARLASDGALSVRIEEGIELRGSEASAVVLIQPLGGKVTYVSDLTPLDYRHTPYFETPWPYARNENLFGEPLASSGRRWLKGLAMHSASRLVYRVVPGAKRFECAVAIDDSAGLGGALGRRVAEEGSPGGSVVFRIYVARGGKFESSYESPTIRSGESPAEVSVEVAGAQAVALVVEFADFGAAQDHANWLDARFVR